MTVEEKKAFQALEKEVARLKTEREKIYHYWVELPEYAREIIYDIYQKGFFQGDSE